MQRFKRTNREKLEAIGFGVAYGRVSKVEAIYQVRRLRRNGTDAFYRRDGLKFSVFVSRDDLIRVRDNGRVLKQIVEHNREFLTAYLDSPLVLSLLSQ